MASSSSSAATSLQLPQKKYDVFLSFRGEDTRRTFTGHLYEGLKNRGIFTFQDDKRLEYGDSISEELLKAIEESQVAVIVFSENYATSSWCLNELVKIIECKDKYRQTIVPIFYDVDPSHVRYQSMSFAEAFANHDLRYKDDVEGMQKVQGWRTALTAVADLKGFDIRDGIESEYILQIVDHVSSKLCKSAYSLSSLQDIVGIDAHIEKLKSLLQIEVNDVQIVGIWGIGGVGKTTIAKAIFDTLSYHFKSVCFLADIKEKAQKNELHDLQITLLSELLRKKDDYVNNKYDGKSMIPSRLRSMKVLVVLDDIDHSDHLEYLAGDLSWFGKGSRVLVTTKNRDLIKINDGAIYEVKPLHDQEAMQLFNQHAFRKEVPDESFRKLSLEVVNHAKGLPLALKVWGSSLHNKSLCRWERIVGKIKKNSSSEIVEKLKISYDGLEPEEQNIFLDIACFFRGYYKYKVIQILQSCDFEAEDGLIVLIEKSLVFLTEDDTIEMHDLIQDMGKYIVKMQKHPCDRSRLWDAEDFKQVMVDNTGSMAVEAIWFPYLEQLSFNKEAMKNMTRLRILCIYYDDYFLSDTVSDIEYLPNNLRWFVWENYPCNSLPQNFMPSKLVHLQLRGSSLHHLWNQTKLLPSLRTLDLSESKRLIQTPDFTGMPNLEYLYMRRCTNLKEVHHSLKCCRKLIQLDLTYCKSLVRFPYVNVESLQYLNIEYCSSLKKFPDILGRMKSGLKLLKFDSGIRELSPSFFQHQTHLTELNLKKYLGDPGNCVSLPSSICMLKGLVKLDVSGCSKLETLPEEIGDLQNLEELYVENTLISRPPSSIIRLNKLKVLSFSIYGKNFVFPQLNGGLRSLEILDLSDCNMIDGGLPEDIGCLSSLKELNLNRNNFEHLPRSISQLGALQILNLSRCKRLKELLGSMRMPNLEKLDLSYCNLIDGGLPEDIGCLSSLKYLNLRENNFEHLPRSIAQLGALQILDLSSCKRLKELPGYIRMPNLEKLDLSGCNLIDGGLPEDIGCLSSLKYLNLRENNFEHLPQSIAQLGALQSLQLSCCKRLKELPRSMRMPNLEKLYLNNCNLIDGGLPEDIGCLSSLKELYLYGNNFEHLPRSIAQLGALQTLDLSFCERLKELPRSMRMPNLETLDLNYCNLIDGGLLEDIGCLSSLKYLHLSGNNFEHLPQSIAQLDALQILDLSSCKGLKQLPEFPQQLHTIFADWTKDSMCNSLFQNISSLQHDISSSDSFSLRVLKSYAMTIPSWFHYRGSDTSGVSVNLPENWYISDNFLGFAVCYFGRLIDITAHFIPLCDDGMSSMTRKLALSNNLEYLLFFVGTSFWLMGHI